MTYNASRGGHAPGFLRDAFGEWVERLPLRDDTPKLTESLDIYEEEKSLNWLIGQLWNCSDIIPSGDCDDLDLPRGSTYAQAVRMLKEELE